MNENKEVKNTEVEENYIDELKAEQKFTYTSLHVGLTIAGIVILSALFIGLAILL